MRNCEFIKGEKVLHSNLGEVTFIEYFVFDNECIIEVVDEYDIQMN